MSVIKDRIIQYLDFKGYSKYRFYKNTGVSEGVLSKKSDLSEENTLKTISYYTDMSPEWLLTGKGEMLKSNNMEKLSHKEVDGSHFVGFYYPNVDAAAGLNFGTNNDEQEKIPISIPHWGENLNFINVFGDSMYPKFQSGEIIGVKEVEYVYLTYGNTYVVVMQNGDVHLKYVRKGKDENHIVLASENDMYEDKEFHIKHIRAFHQVKGVISKLSM